MIFLVHGAHILGRIHTKHQTKPTNVSLLKFSSQVTTFKEIVYYMSQNSEHTHSLSLTSILTCFSRYQNVSILDFIGGGGNNWSYKTCKTPVRMSPPTNQHPSFFTGQMPFLSPNQQCQSTEWKTSALISKINANACVCYSWETVQSQPASVKILRW